jgi:c-di-GMP-related signal transduction protein
MLPAPSCILEIGRGVAIDDAVIEACRQLHDTGYTLALDDYSGQPEAEPLLPFVKFVKVDVQAVDAAGRAAIARRVMHRVRLIAEKVETAEVFEETKKAVQPVPGILLPTDDREERHWPRGASHTCASWQPSTNRTSRWRSSKS